MVNKFISLPEARRRIQLKYPGLNWSTIPAAVADLELTIETQEIKVLTTEDFEKLQAYLSKSDVRYRLQMQSERE